VEEDGQEILLLAVESRTITDPAASRRLIEDISGTIRSQHGLDCRVILLTPGSLSYTSSGKLSRSLTRQHYLAEALPRVVVSA
jgi:fatty-acyl-CoA synthase